MKEWEYMTLKMDTTEYFSIDGTIDADDLNGGLNRHGRQGWELVSIFDTNTQGTSRFVVAIMKRERQR